MSFAKKVSTFTGTRSLKWLVIGMSSGLILAGIEIIFSGYIMVIIRALGLTDQAVQMPFGLNIEVNDLTKGLLVLALLGVLRAVMFLFSGLSAVVSNELFASRLKLLCMNNILYANSSFTSLASTNSMFAETFGKTALFFHSFAHILPLTIQMVCIFTFLFLTSVTYTLIGLVYLVFAATVVFFIQKKIQVMVAPLPGINSELHSSVVRIVKNWFLIKILGIENTESGRFKELQVNYTTRNIFANVLSLLSVNLPSALGIILVVIFLLFHKQNHLIENALFLSYLYLFMRFVQLLGQISNFFGIANIHYPHFKLAWEFFGQIPKEKVKPYTLANNRVRIFSPTPTGGLGTDKVEADSKSSITAPKDISKPPILKIESLGFKYDETNPHLIKDVNFTVDGGMQLAIVGESGSGKSTLLALLMGMLKPAAGSVKIDGLGPSQYLLEHSKSIGYVGPDPFLVEGSLRENLLYGNSISIEDKKIEEILDKVGLSSWYHEKPQGLAFQLSEAASELSTGQKQRVSIARAILRDPTLLILDEISANLDVQTEDNIADAIRQFKGNSTTIIVSHRPGIIKYADQIINMRSLAKR
ncbi:MAG: ABC transporter ATP-binding protein [Bacteriovoracaceae bacterium]|jgi:ABC-type multidrug transport system fused ATPase/permease subunit|nr:ABC transporter ATP-binding protein [Bacteriovoracaceae bacterium]